MSDPRHPRASIDIDAPLGVVWEVMLDLASYGEWNPFIVRADGPPSPRQGDPIRLHVVFGDGRRAVSPERISALTPPYDADGTTKATLSYVYRGWPARLGLLRGTRHQHLTRLLDARTRYDTVEVFSGPLISQAGPGRVADGFRRHAEALKSRAERLAGT